MNVQTKISLSIVLGLNLLHLIPFIVVYFIKTLKALKKKIIIFFNWKKKHFKVFLKIFSVANQTLPTTKKNNKLKLTIQ